MLPNAIGVGASRGSFQAACIIASLAVEFAAAMTRQSKTRRTLGPQGYAFRAPMGR